MKTVRLMRPVAASQRVRWDLLGAGLGAVLVTVAVVVPIVADQTWRDTLYAGAAPIFGERLAHAGWGTVPAIAIAGMAAWYGPGLARRLTWPAMLVTTWATALAWAFALAMVDGWQRGVTRPLAEPGEYLEAVPQVSGIHALLQSFSDRILDFQPDSWATHVAGHPPGALLVFVALERIGLGGPTWAAVVTVLAGTSAAVAVLIAVRALSGTARARAAAPFLSVAPTAVWIAVSADAVFTAVTAWALALLAVSARGRGTGALVAGACAGVLFGFGSYLNYGMVLMAIPAMTVLIAGRSARPLLPALAGAVAVAAAFTASGFWWLDGYHLVVERYYQGIAAERPFGYWGWANLAAAVCATGLAVPASLHRSLSVRRLRARYGASLLVAGALLAIVVADLSALSKAETERIWLPFTTWLLVSAAFLPRRHHRAWLALQAAGTLVLVHLVLTNW
ncbi:hypothetical protein OG921_12305 [Aldersonia sp. NBC_00410]|uniref:hypothetical protein n=1 Tax=Aldersonia sp. NBC_00410 TaxID=2975954 RepID=UPI00224CA672|nr:hypothetical protein [Aldersonia sp. NBC_00410]MCX5043950.1 hypothetical protein [Aldersonia sp. NBC_00410]